MLSSSSFSFDLSLLPRYMALAFENRRCFPSALVAVTLSLACVDLAIAIIACSQLVRMHLRTQQLGWTRQKVLHVMVGSSNIGYFVYFISTLVATCKGWLCWSHACGFILMACPTILFLAAFLLLLSFWVDLCHQGSDEDEDDEDGSFRESFLEKVKTTQGSSNLDHHRKCWPFQAIHVGSRQKFVIVVIFLVFAIMMGFAVLIWIGVGNNPIDSSKVARVYIDFFAIAILLLAGAFAVYGLILFMKMSKVRSDKASSEMWKVAGVAVVSVLCFTLSAIVALTTNIPLLYHWRPKNVNSAVTSLLIILYYFIGSSVPSSFVLWILRDLPPPVTGHGQAEESIVTYVSDRLETTHNPHRWTMVASSQNQVKRASPI